jgi:hypothetical protein
MSGVFTGALRVEFGDWGPDVGRMARLLGPVEWSCGAVQVVVPAGTMTDGASVPRPLWWFLPPWGDEATLPAVLHDYLCEQLDLGCPVAGCETRAACDWQFLDALPRLCRLAGRAPQFNRSTQGMTAVKRRAFLLSLFGASLTPLVHGAPPTVVLKLPKLDRRRRTGTHEIYGGGGPGPAPFHEWPVTVFAGGGGQSRQP